MKSIILIAFLVIGLPMVSQAEIKYMDEVYKLYGLGKFGDAKIILAHNVFYRSNSTEQDRLFYHMFCYMAAVDSKDKVQAKIEKSKFDEFIESYMLKIQEEEQK